MSAQKYPMRIHKIIAMILILALSVYQTGLVDGAAHSSSSPAGHEIAIDGSVDVRYQHDDSGESRPDHCVHIVSCAHAFLYQRETNAGLKRSAHVWEAAADMTAKSKASQREPPIPRFIRS